jgi:hypothetical protein
MRVPGAAVWPTARFGIRNQFDQLSAREYADANAGRERMLSVPVSVLAGDLERIAIANTG